MTPPTALSCPHCSRPLYVAEAYPARLHGCGFCGGIWLDNDASRLLKQNPYHQLVVVGSRPSRGKPRAPLMHYAPRRCPVCRKGMRVVRADKSKVALDICDEHGTFSTPMSLEA